MAGNHSKKYETVLAKVDPPFKIRPLTVEDVPYCSRLLAHTGNYYDELGKALKVSDAKYEAYLRTIFKHCLRDQLSFVIVNEAEPLINDEVITNALKDPLSSDVSVCIDEYNQEASLEKLSRHYVGCALAYDCAVSFPWHELQSEWEYFALYAALFADDQRKDPQHPYHQFQLEEEKIQNARKEKLGWKEGDACNMEIYLNDKRVHLFEIGVAPFYHHQGFGTKLCETVRDTAYASGFSSIEVAANNEAGEKIWKSFGALECYRGYPNKVSKIENGVEQSRFKDVTKTVPYFILEKRTTA
jgi:ribosomal protein S18 acetylase RimI-like enzyme